MRELLKRLQKLSWQEVLDKDNEAVNLTDSILVIMRERYQQATERRARQRKPSGARDLLDQLHEELKRVVWLEFDFARISSNIQLLIEHVSSDPAGEPGAMLAHFAAALEENFTASMENACSQAPAEGNEGMEEQCRKRLANVRERIDGYVSSFERFRDQQQALQQPQPSFWNQHKEKILIGLSAVLLCAAGGIGLYLGAIAFGVTIASVAVSSLSPVVGSLIGASVCAVGSGILYGMGKVAASIKKSCFPAVATPASTHLPSNTRVIRTSRQTNRSEMSSSAVISAALPPTPEETATVGAAPDSRQPEEPSVSYFSIFRQLVTGVRPENNNVEVERPSQRM